MQLAPPRTPEGWERVHGPVASVPFVTSRSGELRREEGCVTIGNRVRALWQDFGHMLGTGTIVGFERHIESGWIKAVIDYDHPMTALSMGEDGYARWDSDRLVLAYPAHWDGETQEESIARWRKQVYEREVNA